jgi:hypothetical protein
MKKFAVLIAGGALASVMLLSVPGNGNSHFVNTPTMLADGSDQPPILPTPPPPKPPPPPTKAA